METLAKSHKEEMDKQKETQDTEIVKLKRDHQRDISKLKLNVAIILEEKEKKMLALNENEKLKKKEHDDQMMNLQKMLALTTKNYYDIKTKHETETKENEVKVKERINKLETLEKSHKEQIEKLKKKYIVLIDNQKEGQTLKLEKQIEENAKLQKKLTLATKIHQDTVASEANYRAKYIALRDEVGALSPETERNKEENVTITITPKVNRGICSRGRGGKK